MRAGPCALARMTLCTLLCIGPSADMKLERENVFSAFLCRS